jgi:hypothetical protein
MRSPALTQTEIVEIEVNILQQHLSRLKNETHTEKAQENIQKAIDFISELKEHQNNIDSDQIKAAAQFNHEKLIQTQSPSPSAVDATIMSDNLSDVSDSFIAELSALVDANLTSTGPERVEGDSELQPPSLTRTRPLPFLSPNLGEINKRSH